MSLRDELLTAMAPASEDVEVGGVTVRVTALSATMQLQIAGMDEPNAEWLMYWVAANCIRDPETGEALFSEDDEGLRGVDADTLSKLATKAMSLSGLSEAAKN